MVKVFTNILNYFSTRPNISFICIFVFASVMRGLFMPVRWINADEGAHLMDARFLLEGLIPIVDYASRQPFYVLFLALAIKVFGISILSARIVPLLASLGIGWILFLLGKRLYNNGVALTASAIYFFLPYTIVWSTIVKTEPLAIFFATFSVYFIILAFEKSETDPNFLFFSGIFSAIAFYIRQPSLYMPISVLIFLLVYKKRSWGEVVSRVFYYVIGYIGIYISVGAFYYIKGLSIQEIVFSQLNPLNLIWTRLLHTLGMLPEAYKIVDTESFRILDQDLSYTINAWRESILFSFFVLTMVVTACVGWWTKKGMKGFRESTRNSKLILLIWPVVALLFYVYQSLNRGFYTQYFLEALPPFVLISAGFLYQQFRNKTKRLVLIFLFGYPAYYALLMVQKVFWRFDPGLIGYFILGILISLFILFFVYAVPRPGQKNLFLFILAACIAVVSNFVFSRIGFGILISLLGSLAVLFFLSILLVKICGSWRSGSVTAFVSAHAIIITVVISALVSGKVMGPTYECTWSPSTLKRVVQILADDSNVNDTILSGGMIWTFESGLQPFADVTHPTQFFKIYQRHFKEEFMANRPTYIIIDGYTKRKYARYWDFISAEMSQNYYFLSTVSGSRYPVEIYRLAEDPAAVGRQFAGSGDPIP